MILCLRPCVRVRSRGSLSLRPPEHPAEHTPDARRCPGTSLDALRGHPLQGNCLRRRVLRDARSDDIVDTGDQIDQPLQRHSIRFGITGGGEFHGVEDVQLDVHVDRTGETFERSFEAVDPVAPEADPLDILAFPRLERPHSREYHLTPAPAAAPEPSVPALRRAACEAPLRGTRPTARPLESVGPGPRRSTAPSARRRAGRGRQRPVPARRRSTPPAVTTDRRSRRGPSRFSTSTSSACIAAAASPSASSTRCGDPRVSRHELGGTPDARREPRRPRVNRILATGARRALSTRGEHRCRGARWPTGVLDTSTL